MRNFPASIVVEDDKWLEHEILSCPVITYIKDAVAAVSSGSITVGSFPDGEGEILAILAPCPALSPEILMYMTSRPMSALMTRGKLLALWGDSRCVRQACESHDLSACAAVEAPTDDAVYVTGAESAYMAQEVLRGRINTRHMKNGVILISPQTTHIAPNATIGSGTTVLPGCMIYKNTSIGENCRIGPNCLLENAVIGQKVSVNSAQIADSSIGDETQAGPFCWIRPGCVIGKKVRIGNFVELKKAEIGDGTKVSHLAYIGDARFGKRINVGCGAVIVNYDGKDKHLTVVGDDTFIGCNVNLVAPVEIGDNVYLAAGSTITEPVERDAMAIARARQVVKPGWMKKRREEGKI